MAPLFAALLVIGGLGIVWQQARSDRTVVHVLASNATWLQQHAPSWLGSAGFTPVAVWHPAFAHPKLAPLGLAQVAPSPLPAPAQPMQVRVAAPMVAVPVAPAFEPAAVAYAPLPPAPADVPARLPRVLRSVAPAYPADALLAGVQGQVVVEFAVNAAGMPRSLRIVASGPRDTFDRAALEALSQWRFAPLASAGQVFRQTFTFRLGAAAAVDATMASGCFAATGTHVCRRVPDADTAVRMGRPPG